MWSLTLAQFSAEHIVNGTDDDAGIFASQRVINRLAMPPRRDETVRSQSRELLGYRRLPELEQIFQFADRFFAFSKNAKDHQPTLVCQSLQKIAGTFGIIDHSVEFM